MGVDCFNSTVAELSYQSPQDYIVWFVIGSHFLSYAFVAYLTVGKTYALSAVKRFLALMSLVGMIESGSGIYSLIFGITRLSSYITLAMTLVLIALVCLGNLEILKRFTVVSVWLTQKRVLYIQILVAVMYVFSQIGLWSFAYYLYRYDDAPKWLTVYASLGPYCFLPIAIVSEAFTASFIAFSIIKIIDQDDKKRLESRSAARLLVWSIFVMIAWDVSLFFVYYFFRTATEHIKLVDNAAQTIYWDLALWHTNFVAIQFYLVQNIQIGAKRPSNKYHKMNAPGGHRPAANEEPPTTNPEPPTTNLELCTTRKG